MQKQEALKVIKKVCEKAQKNGLIESLEEVHDLISAFDSIAINLDRYERELKKLQEQNESFKSTNNELVDKLDKANQEIKNIKIPVGNLEFEKNENIS